MAQGVKTGGRKKGTPNKVSGTVREMIRQSISKELESLPKLLNQLEPKERIDAMIKLMPYIVPKSDTEEPLKSVHERKMEFINRVMKMTPSVAQNS